MMNGVLTDKKNIRMMKKNEVPRELGDDGLVFSFLSSTVVLHAARARLDHRRVRPFERADLDQLVAHRPPRAE